MYVLDTNLVSELRKTGRGKADKNVVAWEAAVPQAALFLSVITIMELEVGTVLLERRDPSQGARLRKWMHDKVLAVFAGRILPIDAVVAQRCAKLHVPDRRPDRDAFIAATALVHGMKVATRNAADFRPTGVTIVNPWQR